MGRNYHLRQTGEEVQALLDAIKLATKEEPGLMSAADKAKLDSIGVKYHTTDYWNNSVGYIPAEGEIIIYSDYATKDVDGETVNIPALKIGTGNAYVQDLAFVDEVMSDALAEHIADVTRHISAGDRSFWNNKLNVNDLQEVSEEVLIFNRN